MKCCICGENISNFGNNPTPLCGKDDYESQCCEKCNNYVIRARMIQNKYQTDNADIQVGDSVVIFWAKNSTIPTETIFRRDKFLQGNVTSVKTKNGYQICEGTWGNFILDVKNDSFCIID